MEGEDPNVVLKDISHFFHAVANDDAGDDGERDNEVEEVLNKE